MLNIFQIMYLIIGVYNTKTEPIFWGEGGILRVLSMIIMMQEYHDLHNFFHSISPKNCLQICQDVFKVKILVMMHDIYHDIV